MIEARDLVSGYGGRDVIHVDELTLPDGQVTCIVGENGCGKSTLLKTLAGLLAYRGSISLGGEELKDLSHRERARRLGYLPQRLTQPAMDVGTLVLHGRFSRMGISKVPGDADRAAITRAMGLCDVSMLADRLLADLSGGELQRAYLAMVVAQEARTLLLDEPTAHMDVARRIEVANILRQLADAGTGVVLTTHDLPECLSVSDEVVLMAAGGISDRGTPAELLARPGAFGRAMGVFPRKVSDTDAIFPYILVRGNR